MGAVSDSVAQFTDSIGSQLGGFLPGLIGALLLLIVGLIVATIAGAIAKAAFKKTNLDNKLAAQAGIGNDVPIESLIGTVVFWVIMLFFVIAILNALQLTAVSEPINGLLQTVFEYLPRVGGAAVILFITWVIAKVAKLAITSGLSRFNLDDRLAEQTGVDGQGNAFAVNETIGNIVYWFIFLLALPLVLSALELPGLLGPIEELIDEFLSAIPQILTAALVFGIGWLVANIVRGIVTNLLMATGVDSFGARFGLSPRAGEGISVSSLAGVLVYTLILIPASIAALNELDIDAISGPAIDMLERVLFIIPQVIAAGVVLTVFYFIGQFVSDLVVNLLSSLGFDRVTSVLGLSEISSTPTQPVVETLPEGEPMPAAQPPQKTPSEIVGIIVLVGVVLFGAVTATEILGFPVLTQIVRSIMAVSIRVLSGVVVFGIGLYAANLAFRLIEGMGMSASNTLAQAARIAIIAFVGAMALQQMGVATSIVNLAFGLLLGAIAVAIAIAFGLGGRDVAADNLREWVDSLKR